MHNIKNIVKLLMCKGHYDLAKVVTAQQESGDMPQHDPGRISNPKPSQPEGVEDQSKINDKSTIEVDDKKEENIYTVDMLCNMSFIIEVKAENENDARNKAPNFAMDTIEEIEEVLDKDFRGLKIRFNKIVSTNATEVVVEE